MPSGNIMNALRVTCVTTLIFVSLVTEVSAGSDERIYTNLHKYSFYRKILIKKEMKPNNNYAASTGATNKDGSPMYDFADVSCGNRICNTQWFDHNGGLVGFYFNRDQRNLENLQSR
jgi:hypothetical protein